MEFITIQETAKILRVAPITVRRFIRDGRLPAVRVGKGVRVKKESIENLPVPIEAKLPMARRTGKNDPLWNIVGIGTSAKPSDIASKKHEYLAEAYAART